MLEKKNEKVCAVLVTYNRKELLNECLTALFSQTRPFDGIIIIDNASTDGTEDILKKIYQSNSVVEHIRLEKNIGGAGGFYNGIKRGYEKQYDWILCVEDEIKLSPDCLEKLLNHIYMIKEKTGCEPFCLSCQRIYYDGKPVMDDCQKLNLTNPFLNFHRNPIKKNDRQKDYLTIEGATFEGLFIHRSIIKKVGFPDKRFFIYGDDTDYCLRIRQITNIYYIPEAKVVKLIKPEKQKNVGWKRYYIIRNTLYLELRYSTTIVKLIRIPKRVIIAFGGRIVHIDLTGIKTIFKGMIDSFKMYRLDYNYFA